MGKDQADEVVDRAAEYGDTRIGMLAQRFKKLFDRPFGGNGEDLWPWRHDLAHGLVAEFHGGLNQVAIAFFENSFFASGFDQGIHGFGRVLGLFLGMLLGERCYRNRETEHDGDGKREINQNAYEPDRMAEPLATGTGEQEVRQQAIADNNGEHERDRGLQ